MASTAELFRRAVSSFQQGRIEEAEHSFKQLLRREPRHLAALNILAIVLTMSRKYADAERYLQLALKINSTSDATFYNYGIVLKALGRPDEALRRFTEAIAVNPGNAETWNNRGTVRSDLGDYGAAIEDFDKAITLNPNYAAALFNKSKSLTRMRRYGDAVAASDRALAIKPDLAEAWFGRAMIFHELQRHDEAASAFANALRIDPQLPFLKGGLLHQKMLTCDWEHVDSLIKEIESDIASGKLTAEPFGWQGIATSERSLQRCAELYNAKTFPAGPASPAVLRSGMNAKIRVGYLSGEFRQQATSLLLVGVLEHHDNKQFDIYAIDNGWDDQSATRRRIDQAVPRRIDIAGLNDAQALAAIRENRIDVLVNLNGYFGQGRTRLFAQRAAPLQVNYLGYPGTLGASYMDYIIADHHVLPAAHRAFYSEKVVYLPNCYQANDRSKAIAARTFDRQECGLPAQGVVFCCFNNAYKVTPQIFDCWMRILKHVDGSVLWLLEDTASAVANLRREAVARGVGADRLYFCRACAVAGTSRQTSLRGPVSRHPAIQCPHHRQRCIMGRAAGIDLPRRDFCRPGCGKPAAQRRSAGIDHGVPGRLRTTGDQARDAAGKTNCHQAETSRQPPDNSAVRYRAFNPTYRSRLQRDGRASPGRFGAGSYCCTGLESDELTALHYQPRSRRKARRPRSGRP
jgi:predicted O-linked N-acetylglucosamine transferase (SPINDLY family)